MCFSVVKSCFKRNGILEQDDDHPDWVIQEHVGTFITPELLAWLYENCGYALPLEMYGHIPG